MTGRRSIPRRQGAASAGVGGADIAVGRDCDRIRRSERPRRHDGVAARFERIEQVGREPRLGENLVRLPLMMQASSARAPLRNTSVNGSENVPDWDSLMRLSWVTAYHSFSGEVEASNTPTIRRLTPSRRHQLLRITLS
jgi:hypothetical protein